MTRRGWMLFCLLGAIWGMPYLLIKIAVEYIDPAVVVFVRVALATIVLLPLAVRAGQLRSLAGHLRWVVVFAVVEIALAFWALNWAEQRITSSLAAILIATVPTVGALLARWLGLSAALSRRRIGGLALGFVGVAALVGLDVAGSNLFAAAAVGITVLGYAFGPIVVAKYLADAPSLAVIAAAMAINTVLFAPLAVSRWPDHAVPASVWIAMAILGLACTAVAFVLFFGLIHEVGAPRAQVITYVNPAVAVLLGIVVLGEPLTLGIVIGFPLVLLGSYFATRSDEPAPGPDATHGS